MRLVVISYYELNMADSGEAFLQQYTQNTRRKYFKQSNMSNICSCYVGKIRYNGANSTKDLKSACGRAAKTFTQVRVELQSVSFIQVEVKVVSE